MDLMVVFPPTFTVNEVGCTYDLRHPFCTQVNYIDFACFCHGCYTSFDYTLLKLLKLVLAVTIARFSDGFLISFVLIQGFSSFWK